MNIELWCKISFLCYYLLGVFLLSWKMKKVKKLPWNQGRPASLSLRERLSIKVLFIDFFEPIVWPYVLWRIYKLP